MGKTPLFRNSFDDKLRAALVTVYRYTPDEADSVNSDELYQTLSKERRLSIGHRENLAEAPGWVAAGYLTADEVQAMSRDQLSDFSLKVFELAMVSAVRATAPRPAALALPSPPDLSRADILSLLAQAVTAMAAQQEQIEELRDQVATLHNSQMAGFNQDALVKSFVAAERDFEGIDVTLKLEEYMSASEEFETAASDESGGSLEKVRNASAAVTGLASLVAGLNAGGVANLREMNRAASTLAARSKRQMKVRSKGEVTLKIGKVIGGKNRGK